MADSLVLTGVKDIKKHTGTEMVRRFPKRGGDTFSLKRWWIEGGVSTVHTKATVFDVTTGVGTVKLAIESGAGTNLRIDHDGSFNFTFYNINEVGRAALFTENFELIEHYVFPRISGGRVMTVTPAGAASRPTPAPDPETLTAMSLSGATTAVENTAITYTTGQTGTATDVVFTLTSSNGTDVINGLEVTFGVDGDRDLTLTGTSANAGTSQSVTVTVTITEDIP